MTKIPWDVFELFEQEFLVELLRADTYRYGQAFLNHFHSIRTNLESTPSGHQEMSRLYNESDNKMARLHVLKWVDRFPNPGTD